MAMADREDVPVASPALTAAALAGLAGAMGAAVATVPFRRPWQGSDTRLRNVGRSVTREAMRAFMGYGFTLRTPELRGVERVLDRAMRHVVPRIVAKKGIAIERSSVGGVPGIWYRRADGVRLGTILYLHGGGYLATTPEMYGIFTAAITSRSYCDVFVPDYRLAPEFPFPAALDDTVAVYEALIERLGSADRLLVGGDSGGAGLATSLIQVIAARGLPRPLAVALFSPQVSLAPGDGSAVTNADRDILPREIPVTPYLQGAIDPADAIVSAVHADPASFPPVYVAVGTDEMFHDSVARFVSRLRSAGVRTVFFEEPDMFHVYMILMPWAAASRRLYADFAERFRAAYEGRNPEVAERLLDAAPPAGRVTR